MPTITLGYDDLDFDIDLPVELTRYPIRVLGVPGMGKSTWVANFALQLNKCGESLIIIDIKDGKLARDVALRGDPAKTVFIAPGEMHPTPGINLLDGPPAVVVDGILDLFERTGRADLTSMTRIRQFLSMGLWLALGTPGSTLADVGKLLTDAALRSRLLQSPKLTDRVREFWTNFETQTAKAKLDLVESTSVRLDELLVPEPLASMLNQPTTTLDIPGMLEDGKLVCVDLVSGIPPRLTKLMGNVLVAHLVTYALSRPTREDNRYIRLIADEFDLLAADSFITAVDKLRAAHFLIVAAHQNLSQLEKKLENSLSGAPIQIFFRISRADQGAIAKHIGSARARELSQLPKHTCVVDLAEDEEGEKAWWPLTPAPLPPPRPGAILPVHATEEGNDEHRALPTTEEAPAAHSPRPESRPAQTLPPDSSGNRGARFSRPSQVLHQSPAGGAAISLEDWG